MEWTWEQERAQIRAQALDDLAGIVKDLAEERHDEKKHGGIFRECQDELCRRAREVYKVL